MRRAIEARCLLVERLDDVKSRLVTEESLILIGDTNIARIFATKKLLNDFTTMACAI